MTLRLYAVCAIVAACFFLVLGCAGKQESLPPTADELFAKGVAHYSEGKYLKARERFGECLKIDPLNAEAHYYIALSYTIEGQNDLAIVGLERAIQIEPNFPEAYYNLGTIFLEKGEWAAAATAFESSIALKTDHVPSHINAGRAYFESGLIELAVAAYEHALELDPDNESALKNLALIARSMGDTEYAIEFEERLAEVRSNQTLKEK